MSILAVGLTSAVIRTVDSPTQVTMSIAATSGGSGTISAVYNSTVSTLVSSSIIVMDGRTMVVGDIVLLAAQTANAQNGPWVLNSLVGGVMSFVRPSYWTGVLLGNFLFYVQQGTANYGVTASVSGAISTGSSVGVDAFSVYTAVTRASNAVVAGNIFTGKNTFQAGAAGSGAVPFSFQAPNPTIMTTPQAHSVEWDSASMYLTSLVSLSGTWTTGSAIVTVTTGNTSGLVIGAAVASGITGTTLTVASIQSLTSFTLSGTPTNNGTALAFTLASRDSVVTTNSFGTY